MDELNPSQQPGEAPVSFDAATDADGNAVVRISGELDISAIDMLQARVGPVLDSKPARLVVDVSELRFADSSAIALWVRWSGQVSEFELRHPSPLLLRVIKGMGLAEKLGVEP